MELTRAPYTQKDFEVAPILQRCSKELSALYSRRSSRFSNVRTLRKNRRRRDVLVQLWVVGKEGVMKLVPSGPSPGFFLALFFKVKMLAYNLGNILSSVIIFIWLLLTTTWDGHFYGFLLSSLSFNLYQTNNKGNIFNCTALIENSCHDLQFFLVLPIYIDIVYIS